MDLTVADEEATKKNILRGGYNEIQRDSFENQPYAKRNQQASVPSFYRYPLSKAFPDPQIVASLSRHLSWSHFIEIIPLKTDLERDFYAQMCRLEKCSVRILRKKIQSMLFERMAISQKPEELARLELQALTEEDLLSPDLVFQNPYILDFLGLKTKYQERDLEQAILEKLEYFLLELGAGFTFVERQKRMIIDGKDYKLDLLFYHRKLKRLIAIELKIGSFEAAYKGQMELYLRWLEKHETEPDEGQPIGLILCAEGNTEQIELLQLDSLPRTEGRGNQYQDRAVHYPVPAQRPVKKETAPVRSSLAPTTG